MKQQSQEDITECSVVLSSLTVQKESQGIKVHTGETLITQAKELCESIIPIFFK